MQFWPWKPWCVQHCVRPFSLVVSRACLLWHSPASLFFPFLDNSSKWMKLTIFYLCSAALSGTPMFSDVQGSSHSATVCTGVKEQSLMFMSSSLRPRTVLKSLPWSCLKSVSCYCCCVPLLLIRWRITKKICSQKWELQAMHEIMTFILMICKISRFWMKEQSRLQR